MSLNCQTGFFLHFSVVIWAGPGEHWGRTCLYGGWEGNWLIRSVIGLFPPPRHIPMELFASFGFGRRTNERISDPWLLRETKEGKGCLENAVCETKKKKHERQATRVLLPETTGLQARCLPSLDLLPVHMCVCARVCVKDGEVTNWKVQKINIYSCGLLKAPRVSSESLSSFLN